MKNKNLIVVAAIVVTALLIFLGCAIYLRSIQNSGEIEGESQIIGGDKDEGGCLIGAGYSWCASKNKCLRVWEEACPESFCLRENVAGVYECGNYVKVVSSLLGGGASYFSDNMTETNCPVVGPDYVTPECKTLGNLDCKEINCV